MALTAEQLEQQKKQAEELLFSGPETQGFAKGLFFGRFNSSLVFPYPELKAVEKPSVDQAVERVRQYCEEKIDAVAIDKNAWIPEDVIAGLGRVGVLGMCAPTEFGGLGFSQYGYCKVMEVIGGHCAATGIFVNAHHSIGLRAIVLFGSKEQQAKWLPPLITGEKLGAFALTEVEAGSDAANVQTKAVLSPDGKHWILNGTKRYITNGGIADILTVMARTPVEGSTETKVTAFIVTPDMPGFEVVEKSMPKCGIRGTATARLAFHDMPVPVENVLGKVGKGLRIALTVLDFGRTTFGASCTGAAKTCMKLAIKHAKTRMQFKQTLSEFDLVKKKIAYMAAHIYAMEAMTAQCAAFIDSGAEDYMLETAMLKLWSTDHLWLIVNDALQIHGGAGYFSDQPLERMMRDARINMIGEGANDVMRAFIALVGMRGPGEELKHLKDDVTSFSLKGLSSGLSFLKSQVGTRLSTPDIPVRNESLKNDARELAKRVKDFGLAVQAVLFKYREAVLERQFPQERIAEVACELYGWSCTLSRLDALLMSGNNTPDAARDEQAGRYYMKLADRRIRNWLASLNDNDDDSIVPVANAWLKGSDENARKWSTVGIPAVT